MLADGPGRPVETQTLAGPQVLGFNWAGSKKVPGSLLVFLL